MKHAEKSAFGLALIALLTISAGASLAQSLSKTPIEPGAEKMIDRDVEPGEVQALARLVRLHGYRCDSISGAVEAVFSRGYTVYCNRHSYTYEITGKGGRWTVTVD